MAIFRQNSEKSEIAGAEKNLPKFKKREKKRDLAQSQSGYSFADFCEEIEDFENGSSGEPGCASCLTIYGERKSATRRAASSA